jgi:hypothetical protein
LPLVLITGGKHTTGVVDTGVIDTSCKFATGINATSGTGGKIPVVQFDLRISREFSKILNEPNVIFRGLGEVDSMKKT